MCRILLVACLAMSLVGCGTIFDPAPYNPLTDPAVLNTVAPPAITSTILSFNAPKPDDAPQKLQALAGGYGTQRDNLMRQQLIFDVPMIGLGVAAIVNPLFEGRKNVTLALALGAAGAAGARTYFGPQAKVTVYNAASLSLSCASLVAKSIVAEIASDGETGKTLANILTERITTAAGSLTGNAVLLAAYNQAQKSLAALQTALGTLNDASSQLEQYGLNTINTATNKVLANVQNVSAVTTAVGAVKLASPSPALAQPIGNRSLIDLSQLTLDLQNYSAQADAMTQRINAVMGALPKCTAAS